MSRMSPDDLERHLRELPREGWDRPEPPPAPWPEEERRRAPRAGRLVLRPVPAAALSLLLVAVGLGAGLLLGGGDSDPDPDAPVSAELRPVGSADQGASGVARLEPRAGGSASVELSGLEPSSGGDFYELWLLGSDGELVSLGSQRVSDAGTASFDVELPVDPRGFRYLDVSREPGDGDPGHSSVSVLRGPAA